MKAKELIKILEKNPNAEITLSVSDENFHVFSDNIVEVTQQGEYDLTVVADISSFDILQPRKLLKLMTE